MMYSSNYNPMLQTLAGAQGYQSPLQSSASFNQAMNPQMASLAWQNLPLQQGFVGIPQQQAFSGQNFQSSMRAIPTTFYSDPAGNVISYSFNPGPQSGMLGSQMGGTFGYGFNPSATMGFSPVFGAHQHAMAQSMNSGAFLGQGYNVIQSSVGLAQPRVELAETNSDIVVTCELPNVNLNDLNLTVTDDSMSISATAWAGNTCTSLHRTIALPTTIRSEHVDAVYSNGILEARLPKSDISTRRRIRVGTAG
ncbi:MAG: Hsp20/alpha crystallin family protein [Bacillota bacterium]